ncbi:MAG: ketopantoate reductase family protein [Parasporobacterium sp.]|nr:ketopantoate reductase family protein [Parasporobacterium sp.]
MKVLVYGAGVIGGQLVHAMSKAGNDVTVIARGAWKETLEKNGLSIHHHIQKKDTIDHPRVLDKPDDQPYDIAFAVMQYRQMEQILNDLAAVNSPVLVLVGNNLSASEMEQRIMDASKIQRGILFGFGSTAGTRVNGKLTTVHVGDGRLTIGKVHAEATEEEKALLKTLFQGSKLSLVWCDNMDAWLKFHAACILPIVYLCYKTGCDLKRSTGQERKLLHDAVTDAYHLLMELGYPVRPVEDEKLFEPGIANMLIKVIIYWMSRTRIGALCTTEHCRHAPGEMEDLDKAFQKLRAEKSDFPMPHFDRLYSEMPSWDKIRSTYGRQ